MKKAKKVQEHYSCTHIKYFVNDIHVVHTDNVLSGPLDPMYAMKESD